MTWILADGFEVYGDKTTSAADVTSNIDRRPSMELRKSNSTAVGPTLVDNDQTDGTFAIKFSDNPARNAEIRYEFPAAYKVRMNASVPTFVIGFRYQVPADESGTNIFLRTLKLVGSTPNNGDILLSNTNSGKDLVVNGRSYTTTVTDAFIAGNWHYVEIVYKPTSSGNGGFIKVYVNQNLVVDSGEESVEFVLDSVWGLSFEASGTSRPSYDDLCVYTLDGVAHTAAIGPRRIVRLAPASDSAPNDWTASTGVNNYAMINGTLPGSTYVEADVSGDDDHYKLNTLSASSVECLQVDVECKAVDGTPHLHIGFDNGVSDEADMGVISTAANVVVRKMFPTGPGSAAWTTASVNDVEATQRMTE